MCLHVPVFLLNVVRACTCSCAQQGRVSELHRNMPYPHRPSGDGAVPQVYLACGEGPLLVNNLKLHLVALHNWRRPFVRRSHVG